MRPAFRNSLLFFAAIAALVAGYATSRLRQPEVTATATSLIDFAAPGLDGKEHKLSEWHGKVIVLNFWATWCGPCREEIPLFVKTQKQHQSDGLQIIGVAIDESHKVANYAKTMRINYPVLLADETGMSLMSRYGNPRGYLPFTVIIDTDGTVVGRELGAYSEKELADALKPLVKAKSATILSK